MTAYIWITIGSALGGIARYWCSGMIANSVGATFPWGTLFVNVVGSFIIGFFNTLTGPNGRLFVPSEYRLFVGRILRRLHDLLQLQPSNLGARAGW